MSKQYKAVAAVLAQAITSINAILTSSEDEMHRIRVTNNLQREADQLLLLTGTGDLSTGQTAVLGPATTIGGKPIGKQRRFTEADLVPSDDKVYNLKQRVEDAVQYFGPEASAEGILANIPDLVIRGVAKKAGLKVTKDEPKELTAEFVGEIQAALATQNGLKPEETKGRLSVEVLNKIQDALKDSKDFHLPSTNEHSALANNPSSVNDIAASVETKVNESLVDAGMSGEPSVAETTKAEEAKQEAKPKPETDPKKKAGK